MLYFSCSMKMGGWVGYRYFSLFSLIALIYGCVGGGGGSDEIGQHCFEREQKLSGVNDNEEGVCSGQPIPDSGLSFLRPPQVVTRR